MSKSMQKRKIKNIVIMLCFMIMAALVVVMAVRMSDNGKANKKSAERVKELENQLSEMNERQSIKEAENESRLQEMSQRTSELESQKEELAIKSSEYESIIRENGMKAQPAQEEKIVYLTFDDGPSDLTPQFLEVLNSYGVNATFFVTYQPQYEETYKQVAAAGNSIQIHTATHDYNKIYTSVELYMEDFNQVYDYVCSIIDKKPVCFRFPGGSTNSYGKSIVRDIARNMSDRGFQFADWNVSVGDGNANATRDSIIQKITAESEGKNHVVLLAHDSGTKTETLAALPQIIEYYKNNGYTFKVIDEYSDMSFAQFIDY